MQIEYSLARLSLFQASAWDPLYQKTLIARLDIVNFFMSKNTN